MNDDGTAPGGWLSPWADAAGAYGWHVTTPSLNLAVAISATVPGGTAYAHGNRQFRACLPEAVLTVIAVDAGTRTLSVRLSARPSLGVLSLTLSPWRTAAALGCPHTRLPEHGQLSVRDVRLTTRMGRTVRYLIPAFIPRANGLDDT